MKQIKLTKGKFALVDNEDFDRVNQFKWHYDSGYAVNKNKLKIYMHRLIMNFPTEDIDHINMNCLDNRSSNLRIATSQQNGVNRKLNKNNTSQYKGVHLLTDKYRTKKWHATIKVYYKTISLGVFENKVDAAKAYNQAAQQYFGEFARLNHL